MASESVVWFRRDLRVGDLPALSAAGDRALGLFVLDDRLLGPSGGPRRDFLYRSLSALDEQLEGRLLVVRGDPVDVVPRVARAVDAQEVHVSADFGPYGRERDAAVAEHVDLVATGSPYAVAPGRVTKDDGSPYKVFTPWFKRWLDHGWRGPARTGADTLAWIDPDDVDGRGRRVRIPTPDRPGPAAGEAAALARWREFREDDLAGYDDERDRPDLDTTSRMSVYLKFGNIHPRTMLADLARTRGRGAEQYRRQVAWRDFYADILFQRPDSARRNYDRKFDAIRHDSGREADELFEAWCAGRTGYPIVDAGMRQLAAEGWMHNRVRMIVASFLVKDLHLPWWRGARHFMQCLVDGDLASNQHGWQWTAGSGTDASPFFRVFNPTGQGEKFDPTGDYVRRWVPELRGVPGKAVHALKNDRPDGYPEPVVDHAEERREALARYGELP
ncbi:cryptochrome/photolyase family protein [Rhodococcus sp. SGAir0479]|uniref:cryptochrome/photolyase family protein n=1 Tax=Rhodococcus sp. SGAir0479 TaxID=2567884 RepID=UPI0010CD59AB|nr:deoxyribodipyrimidine photo-lyase [Rhodococcus sp. SGAir0479]QCQ89923.1 deoxyribodipyrimidine photo-lyase [Rhodococcus sp. SGAir0479]